MSPTLTLPVDVYSPDQLSELVIELQGTIDGLRDAAARAKTNAAAQTYKPDISAELEQLLSQNRIDLTNIAALETLAKDLQLVLEKSPSVHMLLAATPVRTMKRQFVTWFRTEIHPLTLVTFAARGDLGGGAIVQAGSHLYDFSFRRRLLDNKSRLTEIAGV